jgi:16S rRNA (uracil1498-N3)-methyltransferase
MSGMPPRFYAPDLDAGGDTVVLNGDEAMHLTRVLRLSAGASVRVFNGRGLEREAVVGSVAKGEVTLKAGGRVGSARELSFHLTLVQSVLKGDAFDDIVRDATMLGVSAIQPVVAARSEIDAAAIERGRRLDRWRRIAISSAKQCRRAVVPEIRNPASFLSYVGAAFRRPDSDLPHSPSVAIMLIEPAADLAASRISDARRIAPQSAVEVFVGPEGGWSEAEIAQAEGAGATFVTLGDRTLRADAAALVALPVLLYAWGEL